MTTPQPARTGLDPATAQWREVAIPGGTPAVTLCSLGRTPDGGRTLLVRFPPGWSRPGPGSYDVAEEVLFLRGTFEMSGEAYAADDHAWFPSGYPRVDSASPQGALALAWFSGDQQWLTGDAPGSREAVDAARRSRWPQLDAVAAPFGATGRSLARGSGARTWIVDDLPEGAVVPDTAAEVEIVDLVVSRYLRLAPGERLPAVGPGPIWVRAFDRA